MLRDHCILTFELKIVVRMAIENECGLLSRPVSGTTGVYYKLDGQKVEATKHRYEKRYKITSIKDFLLF